MRCDGKLNGKEERGNEEGIIAKDEENRKIKMT